MWPNWMFGSHFFLYQCSDHSSCIQFNRITTTTTTKNSSVKTRTFCETFEQHNIRSTFYKYVYVFNVHFLLSFVLFKSVLRTLPNNLEANILNRIFDSLHIWTLSVHFMNPIENWISMWFNDSAHHIHIKSRQRQSLSTWFRYGELHFRFVVVSISKFGIHFIAFDINFRCSIHFHFDSKPIRLHIFIVVEIFGHARSSKEMSVIVKK